MKNKMPKQGIAFGNKYPAAFMALFFLLLGFNSIAQKYTEPTLPAKVERRIRVDSTDLKVTGCGAPWALSASDIAQKHSAEYFDSCNHKKYIWDPALAAWDTIHIGVAGGAGIDTANKWQSRTYYRNDSLFYQVGSTEYFISKYVPYQKSKPKSEASPYLFSGNYTEQSTAAGNRWRDDAWASSHGDTLYWGLGWHSPDGTEVWLNDSIYYSINRGVTWTLSNTRFPQKIDGMTSYKLNGYSYIIGAGSNNSESSFRETVWRSPNPDSVAFEVVTSSAGWGNRIGSGGCTDDAGNMYQMGGNLTTVQTTIAAGFNDIYKSTNHGITWTKVADNVNVNGVYFLGQTITRCVVFYRGRIYVIGGGMFQSNPYDTRSNKVYSCSVEDVTQWRAEDTIPTLGKIWASCDVWDNKIWVLGGVNQTVGNSNTTWYMDESGKWHSFPYTYTDDTPANIVDVTHATNLVVHKDELYRISGNATNKVYKLGRSNYLPTINVRPEDSINAKYGNIVNLTATTIKNTANTSDLVIYNNNSAYQTANFWLNGRGIIGTSLTASNGAALQVDGTFTASGKAAIGAATGTSKLEITDASGAPQLKLINNSTNYYEHYVNSSNLYTVIPQNQTSPKSWWRVNQFDVGTAPVGLYAPGSGYPGLGYNLNAGNSANVYTYRSADYAYLMELGRGNAWRFNVAPSGSTGATPSFVELLTLSAANSNVGINNTSPNTSAILDITSTTKGFLPPRMTAAQRVAIASPLNGLMTYDSDSARYMLYAGSAWKGLKFTNENTAGSGTVPTFIYNESFTGSTSSTYTLANTPTAGKLSVWKNGVMLAPTTDYTLSGAIVTLVAARLSGDVFLNNYQY